MIYHNNVMKRSLFTTCCDSGACFIIRTACPTMASAHNVEFLLCDSQMVPINILRGNLKLPDPKAVSIIWSDPPKKLVRISARRFCCLNRKTNKKESGPVDCFVRLMWAPTYIAVTGVLLLHTYPLMVPHSAPLPLPNICHLCLQWQLTT